MTAKVYGYRKGPNGVEARKFDGDALPKGWVDCPAKAEKQKPTKRGVEK